jgi:hypothetical protein
VTNNEVALRTRRKKARYGTKVEIAGQPLMVVKSGKKEDFITAEEIVEDLYGKPVDHIVFKEVVSF